MDNKSLEENSTFRHNRAEDLRDKLIDITDYESEQQPPNPNYLGFNDTFKSGQLRTLNLSASPKKEAGRSSKRNTMLSNMKRQIDGSVKNQVIEKRQTITQTIVRRQQSTS